jgi:predicted Rossmann fold nucleotide-binding protein DprA/Smf involved in DNA uptake
MKFTDNDKAVIALTTRLGNKARPSLSTGLWHSFVQGLHDEGLAPSDLFSGRLPRLSAENRDRVAGLLADAASVLVAADELANRGIWLCTIASDQYPSLLRERLGSQAPPVIFGVGNATLLASAGVGIVGSREVGIDGARVAEQIAEEAVRLGFHVVSGAARGVDQLAMNACYRAGGSVVGVLADSLQERIRSADVIIALDVGTTCMISQQHPAAGFSAGAAMARNKLIYALSCVTVVVASDLQTGGTWAGASEALRSRYGQVAVWRGPGEGAGNVRLEMLGAKRLMKAADLESVLVSEAPNPVQISLIP